ncbi:MAG: extradiol ring-cleavage dioxygenase [Chloroflexi bacterium]|jgi:hypothetical protein|nr:extradiol ring-cleavage dioxygenase [Chloroflexota bacterium]
MAQLVFGGGTSHSPIVTLDGDMWEGYAQIDKFSQGFYDTDGNFATLQELIDRAGDRYVKESSDEYLRQQADGIQGALDRLAADIAATAPDVLIIIGDDQLELFGFSNMPAISIFYGDKIISHTARQRPNLADEIQSVVAKGHGMDEHHVWQGAGSFARELIESLIEQGVDMGAANEVTDPTKYGFGHAFGFIITRLMGEKKIPVVPVLLNTYFPPNQPTSARCYDIGRKLRKAIESSSSNLRVGIIASGGLSHFVTNAPLDQLVLDALRTGNGEALCTLPPHLLKEGSSEIKNWVVVAGAFEGKTTAWDEYFPVYRTLGGTGIGLAFASWGALGDS